MQDGVQLCEFTPLAALGILAGFLVMAAGLIATVGFWLGGYRSRISVSLATLLVGLILVIGSTWLVIADQSRPWSGNGEPPCPESPSLGETERAWAIL